MRGKGPVSALGQRKRGATRCRTPVIKNDAAAHVLPDRDRMELCIIISVRND